MFRHVHLNHGTCIEQSIEAIKAELKNDEQIRYKYTTRYLSIKLLEMDSETEKVVEQLPNAQTIIDNLRMIQGNGYGLYMLDKELAARTYVQPSPLAGKA